MLTLLFKHPWSVSRVMIYIQSRCRFHFLPHSAPSKTFINPHVHHTWRPQYVTSFLYDVSLLSSPTGFHGALSEIPTNRPTHLYFLYTCCCSSIYLYDWSFDCNEIFHPTFVSDSAPVWAAGRLYTKITPFKAGFDFANEESCTPILLEFNWGILLVRKDKNSWVCDQFAWCMWQDASRIFVLYLCRTWCWYSLYHCPQISSSTVHIHSIEPAKNVF